MENFLHLFQVFFGHLTVQNLLRILFFRFLNMMIVVQVGNIRLQVDVWVLVQLFLNFGFQRSECVNFVVLIPRVSIAITIKV